MRTRLAANEEIELVRILRSSKVFGNKKHGAHLKDGRKLAAIGSFLAAKHPSTFDCVMA